jgi:hypothetical protein
MGGGALLEHILFQQQSRKVTQHGVQMITVLGASTL